MSVKTDKKGWIPDLLFRSRDERARERAQKALEKSTSEGTLVGTLSSQQNDMQISVLAESVAGSAAF
ncbi:MAG: hypothetical protein VYE73_08365 [Acidobacteriota bacterium]|nr:hypothetical protein [Acidobacteriota bacterium]